jgi:hypothetical protein
MTKQGRHGTRRAKRKLKIDVTPELAKDVMELFECVLQCLFTHHILTQRDVQRLAKNPLRRRRRLA